MTNHTALNSCTINCGKAITYRFPFLFRAYNEEVTVKDTVTSLLNLDYKLYEIIVIDDGSKDKIHLRF